MTIDNRTAIKLVFLIQALASGSLFVRIPDLQQGLGLDAAMLGLTLLGQPTGALSMFLFSSRLVERFGTRPILLAGIPVMAFALFLMGVAPSPPLLFAALVLYAAMFALTNVAMNVEADRVEAATERRVMNTCHGIWSVGQLAVFGLGAMARGVQIPPAIHFGIFVPLIAVAVLAVLVPMRPAAARSHGAAPGPRRLALPTPATLKLLGFMLGGTLVEGVTRQWSVIFARDALVAPEWAQALTLPVFVIGAALGRFLADGWTHRYGPARLARVLLLVALIGLCITIFAPNLAVALIGFLLMGLGICTTFPASTSAAAQLGDRPSSENVAALTMSLQTTMLAAPPLMGFVADAFGIRATFALVVPMVVLAILLARALEPKRRHEPRP